MSLRFLGPLEVVRDGKRIELPPSRKTRALLAYLAVTGRSHRRDRLCSLLWDVADDPRGALRWSLSKLRKLVNEPEVERLVADRGSVEFRGGEASIDVAAIRSAVAQGVEAVSTERLESLAGEVRGEFLEGLELTDFDEFQAWCVAEREQARSLHAQILGTLVRRLASDPQRAISHARALVQLDPVDENARAALVRMLGAAGRRREAEQAFRAGVRLGKELGVSASGELLEAWRSCRASPSSGQATPEPAPAAEPIGAAFPEDARPSARPTGLVGRDAELGRLLAALEDVGARGREKLVLLTGEPGVGKTRLVRELLEEARRRGATVLLGRSYDAERGRAYGPWADALRRIPMAPLDEHLRRDLGPLLPTSGFPHSGENTRERLFDAAARLVETFGRHAPPVVLALDDLQWCDEDSAALLHFVARTNRRQPVLIVLTARSGELPDNLSVLRVLRGLRHDRVVEEMALEPLGLEDTRALVADVSSQVDAARVFEETAGNPLFAIELARSWRYRADDIPKTLTDVVRDRIDRIPPECADLLRWGAVLGHTFGVDRIALLTSMGFEELVDALEGLERHGLLRAVRDPSPTSGAYAFAHDLVRQVVYGELSAPRRRLMHRRVTHVLEEQHRADPKMAADLAHHAALAGEAGLAVRSCVAAGRRCLELFANAEAHALARRGMRLAGGLPEPEKVERMLELTEVSVAARRPEDLERAAGEIEALAERAVDLQVHEHARLGFHMLAYLRWEEGEWGEAQRQMLRAERVSRAAGDEERVVGMAEAARCLAMLERDLGQAEALLLEARAHCERLSIEPIAIPDAVGMLRRHEGKLDEAAELFRRASRLSRQQGDRLSEFRALEHLTMLEIQRERWTEALALTDELVRISEKLREGSEAPSSRALAALCRWATGDLEAEKDLDPAFDELRVLDAKHRLAYALTRAANLRLAHGDPESARSHATEALRTARALERRSEIVLAHVALARAAMALHAREQLVEHLEHLDADALRGVSSEARAAAQRLLEEATGGVANKETERHGARDRREGIS